MREKLIQYIDLLFAGAHDADDIKQEILQNTLDRYDDLIGQGKSVEAAYQLAISGIGDINEILNSKTTQIAPIGRSENEATPIKKPVWKIVLQAVAICLYIVCPIPLFVLQNELGLCGLLAIVGVATALIVIGGSKGKEQDKQEDSQEDEDQTADPRKQVFKAVDSTVWSIGLCAYFVISFWTQAWYITWVIFPMIGAVQGLIKACIDLKEANNHEA